MLKERALAKEFGTATAASNSGAQDLEHMMEAAGGSKSYWMKLPLQVTSSSLRRQKLIREWSESFAQAGRDLDVHQNVLRNWVRNFDADPTHEFPRSGQMKPEQPEIDRLRKEVVRLKAERDTLK